LLVSTLALGAAACVSGFDRNDQIVSGLRILGASAHVADTSPDCVNNGNCIDWADAQAGDTVTFKALVANPTSVLNVTVTWVTCLPSLDNTVTPCTSEQMLRDPTQLPGMPGVLTLGYGETIQFTVPDITYLTQMLIARAQSTPVAQCSLFIEAPILIIAQGTDPAGNPGPAVTALKYLRLSPWSQIGPTDPSDPTLQAYVRNINPSIDALVIPTDQMPTAQSTCMGQTLVQSCTSDADCNGGTCSTDGWCPPAPFPAGKQTICGHIPDADSQTSYFCGTDGVDGSELEYPTIIWYQTAGGQAGINNTNTAGTPTLPARTFLSFTRPAEKFTLYGVVRDGRDGENWIEQTFPALP
jgi:hypothetical protein